MKAVNNYSYHFVLISYKAITFLIITPRALFELSRIFHSDVEKLAEASCWKSVLSRGIK